MAVGAAIACHQLQIKDKTPSRLTAVCASSVALNNEKHLVFRYASVGISAANMLQVATG